MNSPIDEAIAQIKFKANTEMRLRRQFILDTLDDLASGKVKADVAVQALDNIVIETIDRIIVNIRATFTSPVYNKAKPVMLRDVSSDVFPKATVASLDEFSVE